MKRLEHVVAQFFTQVTAQYSQVPDPPYTIPKWNVEGTNDCQIRDPARTKTKQDQNKSMVRCILLLVPDHILTVPPEETPDAQCTIVHFGGGSGHLATPLALT